MCGGIDFKYSVLPLICAAHFKAFFTNFNFYQIMKIIHQLLMLVLASFILLLSACVVDDETQPSGCTSSLGTLRVTNKSLHTVQKIRINGINYGTIDPGDSDEIDLTPGTYEVEIIGISGGSGCQNPSTVNIKACVTQGISCSY